MPFPGQASQNTASISVSESNRGDNSPFVGSMHAFVSITQAPQPTHRRVSITSCCNFVIVWFTVLFFRFTNDGGCRAPNASYSVVFLPVKYDSPQGDRPVLLSTLRRSRSITELQQVSVIARVPPSDYGRVDTDNEHPARSRG